MSDPSKLYRKNMNLVINEQVYDGVAVVHPNIHYKIRSRFPSSIETLKLNTCHRYVVQTKVGKKFSYDYRKIADIEDKGVCIMDIGAFDNKGQNAWALIEFRNDKDVNLDAQMSCNGRYSRVQGVSICQSQVGLRQSLVFDLKTKVHTQDECTKPFSYDGGKTFFYDIDRGSCVYVFQQGKRFHRHRTFGYDDEL